MGCSCGMMINGGKLKKLRENPVPLPFVHLKAENTRNASPELSFVRVLRYVLHNFNEFHSDP
jgi:hypothetical protein